MVASKQLYKSHQLSKSLVDSSTSSHLDISSEGISIILLLNKHQKDWVMVTWSNIIGVNMSVERQKVSKLKKWVIYRVLLYQN